MHRSAVPEAVYISLYKSEVLKLGVPLNHPGGRVNTQLLIPYVWLGPDDVHI